MKRIIIFLVLIGLVSVPTVASARKFRRTMCTAQHFLRLGGTQIVYNCLRLTNGNVNPKKNIRIEQFTMRNLYGTKVADTTGPLVNYGIPDPDTNVAPLTFTKVPGGASYYVCTLDIWGLFSIPDTGLDPGGNLQGVTMMLTIEWSFPESLKKPKFTVTARRRERVRIDNGDGTFSQGLETSSDPSTCVTGQKETAVGEP